MYKAEQTLVRRKTESFVLATDLDGTLLPLGGPGEERETLAVLRSTIDDYFNLVFVTGRHIESALAAIDIYDLPVPEFVICDVGTSIYQRSANAGLEYAKMSDFANRLRGRVEMKAFSRMKNLGMTCNLLKPQEDCKQSQFKLSFYCDSDQVKEAASQLRLLISNESLRLEVLVSVDPFSDKGLLDVVPKGSSKADALLWLSQRIGCETGRVLFTGDSGNDFEALTNAFPAALMGNASEQFKKAVYNERNRLGSSKDFIVTKENATAGVLEATRWFLAQYV